MDRHNTTNEVKTRTKQIRDGLENLGEARALPIFNAETLEGAMLELEQHIRYALAVFKRMKEENGNRYALFGGLYFYPQGGEKDLLGMFASADAARTYIRVLWHSEQTKRSIEWFSIYDLIERKTVNEGRRY